MVVFVAIQAWPIFQHNGLSWLGLGRRASRNRPNAMQNAGPHPPASAYHLRAWPLIYGTLITTIPAVLLGLVIAVSSSIFIVELAPARLRRVVIPVIRLLASVPSVIYGLIGILVLVPFVGNHLISPAEKEIAREHRAADRRQAGRRRRDPHRDGHADHGRADVRGAGSGAELLARGRGRARREPRARDPRRDAARGPPGDRRRRRARDGARARRGRHALDGLRRHRLRRRARATASRSSSSPCARSPRRSWTSTTGSARRR